MPEILEPTIEEQPGERPSWIKVWISVLTRHPPKPLSGSCVTRRQAPGEHTSGYLFSCMIGSLINILISDLLQHEYRL